MSTREVTLDGGSPWGFRMHGGADAQQPLRIARVNPGSKAAQRGIREGDLISSINGQSTRGITNSEAHALLKNAGDTLVLGLNQETTGSPKRRLQKQIQEATEENLKRTSITSTSSIVNNTSTINRTVTNSQQSNESTHTNGVGEHKDSEDTTNNFQSYIKNGTPYTTPRGASNDGQSRDTTNDDTARNHSSIHSNESVAGDDSVITAHRDNTLLAAAAIMADNVCGSSRSRNKRRSRSNRKRAKKCNSVTNQESQETTTTNEMIDEHDHSNINQINEQSNSASTSKLSENTKNICETSESELCNTVSSKSLQDTVISNSKKMSKIETFTEIKDEILNSVNSVSKSKKLDSVMVMVSPDSDICIVEFPKTKPKINSSITICEISDDEPNNTQENNYNVYIASDNETICDKTNDKEAVKSTQNTIKSKNLNTSVTVTKESITKVLDVNKLCGEIDSYKVEYPKPVLERKNSNSGIVKSRSLDDDEQLKITELTDDEKSSACVSESQAIVSEASEAESDVEWETTAELAMQKETSGQQFGKMTVISLPLEEHVTYETSHISPEDERSLRDFLEGLNLVNSPEESVKRIEKNSSSNTESVKMKRAKKRAALAQHFMPYYQNPRYLDVISEEGSDLSDKDNKQTKSYKTQIIDTDDDDDVFEDIQTKYRNKFQSCYAGTNEGAILVGTKLIDHGNATLKEATWSTSMIDAPSAGAEVVYLEDSSNSMTPSDLLDETTGDLDADDEEDISIDWDKSFSENLDIEHSASETSLIKNDNSVIVSPDTASRASQSKDEQIELNIARQPTPPPTPNTPANDTTEELKASNKTSIDLPQPTFPNISNDNIDNDTFISFNDDNSADSSTDIKTKLKTTDGKELIAEIKISASVIEEQSIKENEEELSKEFKNLYDCLKKPNDEYSSQIDSTPNVSRSDSTTSSRSTSQCTAFYNPLHSSLTNIAAMLREGSFDDKVERLEPAPLREICVRTLLSMPFGKDIIEELANVSQSLEEMTCRTSPYIRPDEDSTTHNKSLPSSAPLPIPPPVPPRTSSKPDIDASSILLVDTPVVRTPPQKMERWIGMPTEENPNLLVCLSPSQKEFIDKTRTFPNEADSLLDLHRKYIERRGYHEEHERTAAPTSPKKDGHTVPAFKIKIDHQNNNNENNLLKIIHNAGVDTINNNDMYSAYNTNLNYNNYVKQFTREIPMHELKPSDSNQELNMKHGNIRYDKYIKQVTREVPIQVEKQINKPVNNKIYSAALSNESTSNSRLKARHLGEWLNLARNECDRINNSTEHIRELHNLHSSVNKLVSQHSCEERFSNSSDATFKRGTSPRRFSLPFNLYEQQMQYILEKEREIEREIEKLKEEKSSLENHEKINANHINIPVQHEFTKRESAIDGNTFKRNEASIPMSTENKFNIHSTELFKELHVTPNKKNVTHEKSKEHIIPIQKEAEPQNQQKPKTENNNKHHFDFTIPEFHSFMEEKSKFESNENFKMSYHREEKKEEKNYSEKVEKSEEHHIPIYKEYNDDHQTKTNLKKNYQSIPEQKSSEGRPKFENTELFKELHIGLQQKPEEHFIPIHKEFDAGKYQISRKGDIAILNPEEKLSPKLTQPTTVSEKFRQEMYNEYMSKIAERQERKQNKVIKVQISSKSKEEDKIIAAMSPQYEVKHVTGIEDEFMNKVREKKGKLGEEDSENEEENIAFRGDLPPVKIIDGSSPLKDAKQLPKHLQEFIDYTATPNTDDGVWSPGKSTESTPSVISHAIPQRKVSPPKDLKCDETAPVVWTPRSAGSSPTAERKEFRPVNFESPTLGRKNKSKESTPAATPETVAPIPPPWEGAPNLTNTQEVTTILSSSLERKLTTSQSAPVAGLNNLGKLPRAQNPTITLLQKAREGQLPRGASYIEDPQQNSQKPRSKDGRPPLIGPGEILYTVKNEYTSESDSEKPKKMADLGPRKFEGIGPTTKDGMPIVLRSEVKESNQAKWYKRMYDTLHRAKNDDEYVTVRYKTRRGRYPYTSAAGYLSEPEPNAYDSDAGISASKYATLDRRRLQTRDKENEYITYTVPRNKFVPAASVKHTTDVYKNQPGRIENYVPGHSSISEKEAKEWWDEVMEIFDGHLEQQKHVPPSKSFMSHALKESGYESDSTLVFRRREDAALQLSPHEQKEAYKTIQKGGEVPLHGLRKPAPERPKESPRKYVEDEVTIHYRSPIRHEIKEAISEEELARRQAEAMRRIYQEERRRKYLQELQDMNSRRHTDNFIPSQKSPISLNRYDDFIDDLSPKIKIRDRSPEPRLVARALYNFVGQSARELTFRKGDVIFIRRQVDKNWYEGEHNAMIGLFPSNYVEIVPYDGIKSTPRKANEGQARAKFNFIAQTHLELSLAKGELVVLTRRVDDNWFEGRIGNRKGIFPVSYVEILIDPSEKGEITLSSSKPVASPAAHSLLLNGSSGGKESMGSHHYQPNYSSQITPTSYHAKPVNVIGTTTSYQSISRSQKISTGPAVNEALHIDTHHSEPIPYRALYKYRPQNDDELELQEGDTVFVLEKCDDGWYVGSSQRTGAFGTFPGNYVERI